MNYETATAIDNIGLLDDDHRRQVRLAINAMPGDYVQILTAVVVRLMDAGSPISFLLSYVARVDFDILREEIMTPRFQR